MNGNKAAVNPAQRAPRRRASIERTVARGRQRGHPAAARRRQAKEDPFADFDGIFALRKSRSGRLLCRVQKKVTDEDLRRVQRQAFAGMLWSKQYLHYDVTQWLTAIRAAQPPRAGRPAATANGSMPTGRRHLHAGQMGISLVRGLGLGLPSDDLAYLDPEYAKHQLILLCQRWYMHPNGQLPAYEWNFGDVNPPVQAWAALRLYEIEQRQRARATASSSRASSTSCCSTSPGG